MHVTMNRTNKLNRTALDLSNEIPAEHIKKHITRLATVNLSRLSDDLKETHQENVLDVTSLRLGILSVEDKRKLCNIKFVDSTKTLTMNEFREDFNMGLMTRFYPSKSENGESKLRGLQFIKVKECGAVSPIEETNCQHLLKNSRTKGILAIVTYMDNENIYSKGVNLKNYTADDYQGLVKEVVSSLTH